MASNPNWQLEAQGRQYPITAQGLTVGRGQDNDIVLSDEQVSRRHAFVWDSQGIIFIRDEGSTNGVYVNGKRVAKPMPLPANAQIQLGSTMLVVRSNTGGTVSPPVGSAPRKLLNFMPIGVALAAGVVIVGGLLAFTIWQASSEPPLATPVPTRVVIVTPVSSAATVPPLAPDARLSAQARALLATVSIECPLEEAGRAVFGSGTLVDARGLILTNLHVVRHPDTRQPCNREERIYVRVTTAPDRPPNRIFRAIIAALDPNLDLAMLKLVAGEKGEPLPALLDLQTVPVGNSDNVHIGNRIQVIGFPGLGGDTLTLTEGIVSGFLQDRLWIKTDTEISHGNSGGTAIDAAGELIGVPTIAVSDPSLNGKIGLVRPINLAKPLIEQARSE